MIELVFIFTKLATQLSTFLISIMMAFFDSNVESLYSIGMFQNNCFLSSNICIRNVFKVDMFCLFSLVIVDPQKIVCFVCWLNFFLFLVYVKIFLFPDPTTKQYKHNQNNKQAHRTTHYTIQFKILFFHVRTCATI